MLQTKAKPNGVDKLLQQAASRPTSTNYKIEFHIEKTKWTRNEKIKIKGKYEQSGQQIKANLQIQKWFKSQIAKEGIQKGIQERSTEKECAKIKVKREDRTKN